MQRGSDLASSFFLSLAAHLSVAMAVQLVIVSLRDADLERIFEPLAVTLVAPSDGAGDGGDGLPPPPARGSPEEPAPAPQTVVRTAPLRRVEAPPPKPAPARRAPPREIAPVREARVEAAPVTPIRVDPPPPSPAAEPAPETRTAAVSGRGENVAPGHPRGFALSGDGRSVVRRKVYGTGGSGGGRRGGTRSYAPDAPGYSGRLLAQVSVPSSSGAESYYGRVHLIPEDGRDYSQRTLFGYSFRENYRDGGFREFQVGRVQTHGAYLAVTDLYGDGRHSTMGHTVILPFPRGPGHAFEVRDRGGGSFRMSAPGGAWLEFDGRSGGLLAASGFRVAPRGASGTAPRVGYDGVHVVIQSVGGNPFLRGRAATVFDGRGGRCSLTTTDLFVNTGTRESDMFRFGDDAQFFSFLGQRCPGLDLPRVSPTQMVQREIEEKSSPSRSGGLIGSVLDLFR